jgi:Flp pilus assembly protein TadD
MTAHEKRLSRSAVPLLLALVTPFCAQSQSSAETSPGKGSPTTQRTLGNVENNNCSGVGIDPNSFDAQLCVGRSRYARSDTAGASMALQKAVALRPADPEARFLLATVLEVAGDQDQAIAQYKELQRISPRDPRGYVGLGGILGKLGNAEEALAQLRKARELDPSNFETNMALGRLLAKTGNLEDSIRYLQEAARQSPKSPEVHYQLALSLQRAGRKDEATKEFAEVDRLNRERRVAAGMGMGNTKP